MSGARLTTIPDAELRRLYRELATIERERDEARADLTAVKLLCPVSPDTTLRDNSVAARVEHALAQKDKLRSLIEDSEARRMEEVREARAALGKLAGIEWTASREGEDGSGPYPACPACGGLKCDEAGEPCGHEPGCWLAAALASLGDLGREREQEKATTKRIMKVIATTAESIANACERTGAIERAIAHRTWRDDAAGYPRHVRGWQAEIEGIVAGFGATPTPEAGEEAPTCDAEGCDAAAEHEVWIEGHVAARLCGTCYAGASDG